MHVKQLDHLNLSVQDLEATIAWYGRVFGFARREAGSFQGRPWAILQSGEALLCCYEHPERTLPDLEQDRLHGVSHFGLRITDRAAWEATVEREDVEVLYGGAVTWPHSTAWYVRDPTGHEIEVALWNDGVIAFPQPAAESA